MQMLSSMIVVAAELLGDVAEHLTVRLDAAGIGQALRLVHGWYSDRAPYISRVLSITPVKVFIWSD